LILCFELQKLIFVCGQAVRQTAVAAAKTAGKPREATHLGALAVAHFFEKEKKAALETKAAVDKAAADKAAAKKVAALKAAADKVAVDKAAADKAAADKAEQRQ
jgi:colicin import membrane protein